MPEHHSSGHESSSSHSSSSSSSSSSSHHSSEYHSSSSYRRNTYDNDDNDGNGEGGEWSVGSIVAVVAIFLAVGFILISSANDNKKESVSFPTSVPLAQDPTVISDLKIMHDALNPHLEAWETQREQTVHHASVAEAGLPDDFNTKEVVYGYCSTEQFYMFVLNITSPDGTSADTEGYEFTPDGTPYTCAPSGWRIMSSEFAADDWYFITADTSVATQTAS